MRITLNVKKEILPEWRNGATAAIPGGFFSNLPSASIHRAACDTFFGQ